MPKHTPSDQSNARGEPEYQDPGSATCKDEHHCLYYAAGDAQNSLPLSVRSERIGKCEGDNDYQIRGKIVATA